MSLALSASFFSQSGSASVILAGSSMCARAKTFGS
jgi:hypothetical protein